MSGSETEDLEALFDEIAAQRETAVEAPDAPAAQPTSDEEDLELLFDQIAAETATSQAMPSPVVAAEDDLEALFDQVAAERAAEEASTDVAAPLEISPAADAAVQTVDAMSEAVVATAPPPPQEVFQRIGALTRNLHDALRELGYDKTVEEAVSALPDTRDRLTYIAQLTGQAAERALTAVEQGQQYQNEVQAEASELAGQWDRVFNGELPLEEFKHTAVKTRSFLRQLEHQTTQTNAQFTEIMMAQDFHDLTGQVIQRIVKVAQNLESQLVKLLLETTPADKRPASESEWLTGPAMNAADRSDVVANQQQVDDLLESLGF